MNMHLCANSVDNLVEILGSEEAYKVIHLAKKVQSIEDKWRAKSDRFFKKTAEYIADLSDNRMDIDWHNIDFESLFVDHSFAVMFEAFATTKKMPKVPNIARMATPKGRPPRSLKELMVEWDKWRKKKEAPPRQKAIARKVKNAYIKKAQEIVGNYERRRRAGEHIDKSDVANMIENRSKADAARARTIVETETTRYWNRVRRDTYDASPDVTHYLFVAIRDMATTKWCKTRTGLVYAKGDPLLDKETPPCFEGSTPILTLDGWKRIDCIGTVDYVWTHEQRWRRVTKIYRSVPKSTGLFQIGFALATANHPYFERGTGFVEAKQFRPEKGVWTSSLDLFKVLKSCLDALVQARPKILLHTLSHYIFGGYSAQRTSSEMERWSKNAKEWLCEDLSAKSPKVKQTGVCPGTHSNRGDDDRSPIKTGRSGPSQESNKDGQPARKPGSNDKFPTQLTSSKTYFRKTPKEVFNLDIEQDHTYVAGGYLVHNCHWNCRSEILPLTHLNPKHKALIDKEVLRRRNHSPEPLPPGWNSSG